MKFFQRLRLIHLATIAMVVLLTGVNAHAGTSLPVATSPESKIRISLDCWIGACPPTGMVPTVIHVENGSDKDHTWTITARSSGNGPSTTTTVSAQAGKTVDVPFYPAVGMHGPYGYWRQIYYNVSGPGVGSTSVSMQQPPGVNHGSGGSHSAPPFIAMGMGIALKNWTQLDAEFAKAKLPFDGVQVDMSKAPEDWRGYSAIEKLWITDSEWTALGTSARAALLDWLALGGRLRIFTTDTSDARIETLKLPAKDSSGVRRHGAGVVDLESWNGSSLPMTPTMQLASKAENAGTREQLERAYASKFRLADSIGAPTLHSGLIFIFIAIFGTLVGPVNLYYFSRAGRRQRLFWVTPLISLAASVALVLLMIFQDGIGGTGARRVLVIMQPAQTKHAVVQEQISRTGVLLGRSFAVTEPSWMEKIEDDSSAPPYNRNPAGSSLQETEGRSRSGDWFRSRSLQTHVLEAVRASRGQIDFFPPSKEGDAPSVVSSLPATLDTVYIVESADRVWTASSVTTGEKKKMTRATINDFHKWAEATLVKEAGPLMASRVSHVRLAPGLVMAESSDVSKFAIPTLDSIRWKDDRAIFAGPYVKHEQP